MQLSARTALIQLKSWARPKRSLKSELLDDLDVPSAELEGNFRDIRFVNRFFGGNLTARVLQPLLPPLAEQPTLRLLDLATGVADVPLDLARRWSKQGYQVKVTALDLNPKIVELACKAALSAPPNVQFEAFAADVFTYPYPTENTPAYDFVTCALAFHHFGPAMCVRVVELMAQLARRAFVVNDLERSWFGYFGAKLLCLTFTRHRLTRHDAPLSVLRAFSPAELLEIGQQAQLPPGWTLTLRKGPFARLALVGTFDGFKG